jgi:hypothetical protein
MLSVIDRLELIPTQQFGQLPCVDAVALVSCIQQSIPSRVAHHDFRDVRLNQVVQPGGRSPFLKRDVQVSMQTAKKLQNRDRFGFDHAFHHQLARGIQHRHPMKPKRKSRRHVPAEAAYVCDSCGEEIVISVDLSAGESQQYVEDCPVCCRPNLIHVEIEEGGEPRVWAERE